MKKRIVVDSQMCRQVQLMLKGGASIEEAARITGTSVGTVGRIKKAEFNIDKFNENKERRRLEDNRQAKPEEITGQITMEQAILTMPEEKEELNEMTKLMRFQAKQVDKIRADIQSTQYENLKAIYELKEEMVNIRDMLGQIRRRMKLI